VNAAIAVPAAGGWFDGHFPGRPILPGVAALALVLDTLAQETGSPAILRGIAFVRLRQLVLPGDQLELATREFDNGHLRFDLRREGFPVANGELILGPHEQSRAAASVATAACPVAIPPLDALLPQCPPMRLLTAILNTTADGLSAAASIPAACALVRDGSAPALVGLEAAAQAAAAWEAMRRWREGDSVAPRIGYLVALRDVVFFAERAPADQALLASVRLEAAAPPLTHYQVEVSLVVGFIDLSSIM
jgi:predicted hotdog family 3-hydroxylacyl-ACP dehydratase